MEHKFDRESFLNFVLDNNVVGFSDEPVRASSGRVSHWNASWEEILRSPEKAEQLADYLLHFLDDLGIHYDSLKGISDGASTLASLAESKREYRNSPRARTVLVEEVTGSGREMLESVVNLSFLPVAAVGLVNRSERCIGYLDNYLVFEDFKNLYGRAAKVNRGYQQIHVYSEGVSVPQMLSGVCVLHLSMSNALELLPLAYERIKPDKRTARVVEEEFRKYGIKDLSLMK